MVQKRLIDYIISFSICSGPFQRKKKVLKFVLGRSNVPLNQEFLRKYINWSFVTFRISKNTFVNLYFLWTFISRLVQDKSGLFCVVCSAFVTDCRAYKWQSEVSRVYWASRGEYMLLSVVSFVPLSSLQGGLHLGLNLFTNFPANCPHFFLLLLHTKVFTCFMWCWDCLCLCPAKWVAGANRRHHGDPVQRAVYCRCTLSGCKNV